VQQKMQEELDQVCGDLLPALSQKSELVYTEAVLMEALRMSCIVPLAVHTNAINDTTIKKYFIPKVLIRLNFVLAYYITTVSLF